MPNCISVQFNSYGALQFVISNVACKPMNSLTSLAGGRISSFSHAPRTSVFEIKKIFYWYLWAKEMLFSLSFLVLSLDGYLEGCKMTNARKNSEAINLDNLKTD